LFQHGHNLNVDLVAVRLPALETEPARGQFHNHLIIDRNGFPIFGLTVGKLDRPKKRAV
jgi:hypothetical protein